MSRRRAWPAAAAALGLWALAAPAATAQSPDALASALARLPADPPVGQVLRAVLARAAADPARLADAAARARRRGWAPRLHLEVRRGQGRDLSSRQTADDAGRRDLSTDDELTLVGRLTFDLDHVVFAPEEVALAREARAAAADRHALVGRVVDLYFERRRILLEAALGAPPDAATALRVAAIVAELEALAGRRLFTSARGP